MKLALVLAAVFCLAPQASPPVVGPHSRPARALVTPWWKHAVFYEIYPRSFQDSNGDGTGDLNGITQRLDYLQALGVNAIWITPCYPSPQVDFGYDISNYEAIDPQYGTLADFDRLIAEAKKRNIRVLMDMVLNHTSDQHPWFVESRSSRDNPKRDWYIWRDGKTGADGRPAPPNNWLSLFGGPAWKYDPQTGQYYYHFFYAQQPDLNWRNPQVQDAMFAQMKFWLDRGVAGFRLDAIDTLLEDPTLADSPVERDAAGRPIINDYGDAQVSFAKQANQPGLHALVRRLRELVNSYPGDRVLIGETYTGNIAELDQWYGGAAKDELQLPMDTMVGLRQQNDLRAESWRSALHDVETQVQGSQPLLVFDNHDNPRLDRFCSPPWGVAATGEDCARVQKMLATVLFLSRDAALMYYGDEIGMATTPPTRKQDVKDPIGITGWPKEKGRDGERTPMQWSAAKNAGFSTAAHTWLPVPPHYVTVNVQTEQGRPDSMLNFYKRLIALRSTPAFRDTSMEMLSTSQDAAILAWSRGSGPSTAVVLCNFSPQPQTFALPNVGDLRVTLANFSGAAGQPLRPEAITLPAWGAVVAQPAPAHEKNTAPAATKMPAPATPPAAGAATTPS